MDCPKCSNEMSKLEGFSFSAFKCNSCSGIWFRDSGHKIAKEMAVADKIDEPNTNSQSVYNLVRDFDCPECESQMIKMVDPTQLTIEFESCADCYGVFFDAGEFSDFSEFTLMERVTRALDTFKTNLSSS